MVPKPETWANSIVVLGRTLTYDPDNSNNFAFWSDPDNTAQLEYHTPGYDELGERIVVADNNDPYRQWTYVRAKVGWTINPNSGLYGAATLDTAPAWDLGPENFPTVRGDWNEKFLTVLRDAIKAAMEADPYYFDIPILNERIQDIDAKIDETVAMTGGVCIVLVVPKVGGALPNILGANFSDIGVTARIIESLNLNDTGKAALDIAVYTVSLLPQLIFDTLPMKLKPSTTDPAIALANDPRGLTYDANFNTEGGTRLEIPRLADVTINVTDLAAIALVHATPGAAIFYTTDLSYPAPRNPAAHLFLAPFSSPSGSTIRARAWLPGYLPSAELKQQLA
jgi:hypothetical protein